MSVLSLANASDAGSCKKARDGHYQVDRVSYGYCYIPRQDVVFGHLVVDEGEATVVRLIYVWLIDEFLATSGTDPALPQHGYY